MAYLTLSQLKTRALESAQRYRAEYTSTDADLSYDFAVARCGFENPTSSADEDYVLKQYWLIEIMKLYFYKDVLDRNLFKIDYDGLKGSQIPKTIAKQIDAMEAAFDKAKEASETAHLFVSAEDLFGEVVVGNGLVDDMSGMDYREA